MIPLGRKCHFYIEFRPSDHHIYNTIKNHTRPLTQRTKGNNFAISSKHRKISVKKKWFELGKHNLNYLLNECHRKRIPGHYPMVHQLHKGRQGEGQHVSKAGKHKEAWGWWAQEFSTRRDGSKDALERWIQARWIQYRIFYRTVKDHWDKQLGHRQRPYTRGSVGRRQVASQWEARASRGQTWIHSLTQVSCIALEWIPKIL